MAQAGFTHVPRGRLRPDPRDRERPPGRHRRHLPLRGAVLGLRLRVHVRRRQRLHRPPVLLLPRRARTPTARRASRSWRSSSSSTPSPTHCSTITSGAMIGRTSFWGELDPALQLRLSAASSTRSSGTGPAGPGRLAEHHPPGRLPRLRRFDGRPHDWRHGVCWRAPSSSALASVVSSSATVAGRCPATTWSLPQSAVSSSGSVGTVSIWAAPCPRWTLTASAALPPTLRWPAPRKWALRHVLDVSQGTRPGTAA